MSQSLFVSRRDTTQRLSGTSLGSLNTQIYENFVCTTTGAATATLANGAFNGQIVSIILRVDGGDLVVAGDFQAGLVSATFADAGDSLTLRWLEGDGWSTISNIGTVILA